MAILSRLSEPVIIPRSQVVNRPGSAISLQMLMTRVLGSLKTLDGFHIPEMLILFFYTGMMLIHAFLAPEKDMTVSFVSERINFILFSR